MDHEALSQQASQMECLLSRLMRRLFTLDPDHPVSELPVAQLRVCVLLQGGARPMSALGDELGISLSATTQIADRLEKGGLVERVSDVEDRRLKKLKLTATGAELMRSRRETRLKRAGAALSALSSAERIEVLNTLRRLVDAAPVQGHLEELAHEERIMVSH